jgi:Domain of unknown function (DUF4277)
VPFDRLRANGSDAQPFVVSLSNHEGPYTRVKIAIAFLCNINLCRLTACVFVSSCGQWQSCELQSNRGVSGLPIIERAMRDIPQEIEVYQVHHLPIVKAYADKISLVEVVNQLVPTEMAVDPGTVVLGLILDALRGRSPL